MRFHNTGKIHQDRTFPNGSKDPLEMSTSEASELPALVRAGCTIKRWAGRLVQENQSLDQHHPGASRHPSSAEEGNSALDPTLCAKP